MRPPSLCVLPCSSLWAGCVLISSFYNDNVINRVGSAHINSFYLIYLFKALISLAYSQILRYWGLRLEHKNLGRDKIKPITVTESFFGARGEKGSDYKELFRMVEIT